MIDMKPSSKKEINDITLNDPLKGKRCYLKGKRRSYHDITKEYNDILYCAVMS